MKAFKTTPFKHQLAGLQMMKGREAFANFCEMGTGKTWMHINEMALLWGEGKLDHVLVLAPKGVHSNWVLSQLPAHMPDWVQYIAREWNPDAGIKETAIMRQVIEPCKNESKTTLRILAVNWDAIQTDRGFKFIKEFCALASSLMIVGDESQRVKNPSSARFKALMKLRPYSRYRRIMSGTAVLQGPFDLYSQFTFLDETILRTTSYYAFKSEYAELLQPGNKLLDHIIKSKTRMSKADIVSLSVGVACVQKILDNNGRQELILIGNSIEDNIDSGNYEQSLRNIEQLRDNLGTGVSAAKTELLSTLRRIESVISLHVRKSSSNFNPKRLPQIVVKDKDGAPRYRNIDKLKALIAPHSYRVLKKECLDLPEKVYFESWFRMTRKQDQAYALMKKEARLILEDGSESPINKLAALMKLSQICSGFIIEPVTGNIIKLQDDCDNPKLQLLNERLHDSIASGKNIIVWARFTEEILQIKQLCEEQKFSCCTYTGATSKSERPRLVQEFEEGDTQIFIGQQAAGGTGITLVRAEHVIYYSNSFKLEDRLQSEDRAHRIGQKNSVLYEDLMCPGTVDVKITTALRNKQEIAALINGDIDKLLF